MKPAKCDDISEFVGRVKKKEVVCWGAGKIFSELNDFLYTGIEDCLSYVVDSNPELWGTAKKIGKTNIEIRPPQHLYDTVSENTALLFTLDAFRPIFKELSNNHKLDNVECYAAKVLYLYERDKKSYSVASAPVGFKMNETPQIPKIIHYIWFGGNPLSDRFKANIESWRKFCPDWEIKEWNESNYDVESHHYMRDAIVAKRIAFASDYARLDIIYNYGGVYLDVDVELVRSIDELLYCSAFCGFENVDHINTGHGFGARKHHKMIKEFRDSYDSLEFTETIPCPVIQTNDMKKYGLQQNGQFQIVNDVAVFPAIYFCPISFKSKRFYNSAETFSIHQYVASWYTDEDQKQHKANLEFLINPFNDYDKEVL